MATPINTPENIFTVAGRGYVRELLSGMDLSFGANGFINRENGLEITDAAMIQLLIHRGVEDALRKLHPADEQVEKFMMPETSQG